MIKRIIYSSLSIVIIQYIAITLLFAHGNKITASFTYIRCTVSSISM